MSVSGSYDVGRGIASVRSLYSVDSSTLEASVDSHNKDISLKYGCAVDRKNTVSSVLSLKSRRVSYEWIHKWVGGCIRSAFHPSESVSVEWKDHGSTGAWTTKATVPLDNLANTKVSFSHDWGV
jgi:hypothetical protein